MIPIVKKGLIVLAVAAAFASCALPNMPAFEEEEGLDTEGTVTARGAGYQEIPITVEAFVIEWDAPSGEVASYNIYYREHGFISWELLANVPATENSYTVDAPELYGLALDFAMQSVDGSGNESELHTSLDEDVDPPTGWYLFWDR